MNAAVMRITVAASFAQTIQAVPLANASFVTLSEDDCGSKEECNCSTGERELVCDMNAAVMRIAVAASFAQTIKAVPLANASIVTLMMTVVSTRSATAAQGNVR